MRTTPLIYNSLRCNLFESIAEDVWKRIVSAHQVGVDLNEPGLTKDIIVEILQYNRFSIPNFDVYARPSYNEATYGSDMDVFIEVSSNRYIWIALQAKILKTNKRYTTLRDSSDGIMQWDKLKLLEAVSGCKSYYLLYNGFEEYRYAGFDACGRRYLEPQFGCSLVEPDVIERLASIRNRRGYVSPHFNDLHPNDAEPWRILVCCFIDIKDLSLFSIEEIRESNLDRIEVTPESPIDNGPEAGSQDRLPDNSAQISNRILNGSREAKWNPDLRIVINASNSLNRFSKTK
jgi:hypothetical protein